jgi:tRNA pseudouridine55 synthase
VDGVLVVDKPQGLTSHDVVAVARRLLHESRIGHTGTLDPLATGVLPLACGRATRLVRFLTASEKEYIAGIRFGLVTDSYDVTGMEISRTGDVPSPDVVERALASLRGEYLQTPPAYSAKKVEGERAYARARRSEPVALTPVPVRVMRAELLDFEGSSARVAITCSAGFYVRSFAHTLGERVHTGACLESLQRTRSGEFTIMSAVSMEELHQGAPAVAGRVVPLERLLPAFPSARVTDEGRLRVSHGQEVNPAHLDGATTFGPGVSEWVRLLDGDGRLLALATPGHGEGTHAATRSLHPAVVLT